MKDNCLIVTFMMFILFYSIVSSCEKSPQEIIENPYRAVSNNFAQSFVERTNGMPLELVLKEKGKLNAIRKAYQLTEFHFIPRDFIDYCTGTYIPDVDYKGVMYSSTKEIGTSVGNNVSFYTFATAIRNPRSKLYTEHINEPPYHGVNCRAYYGTVCSELVSYALGIYGYASYDFADSESMVDICYESPEDVEVADVIWRDSHVSIITDIRKNKLGIVEMVEISEAIHTGSVTKKYDRASFDNFINRFSQRVFRYVFLENNIEYVACPDLVPVLEEEPATFVYNDKICVDKGDKSNYLVGEDVIINVFAQYDSVVVYKDNLRYTSFIGDLGLSDVPLPNLGYGSYKAFLYDGNSGRQSTSWIVVDFNVLYDSDGTKVLFGSRNAIPFAVKLCKRSGSRGCSANQLFFKEFTNEEISSGVVLIPHDRVLEGYSYVQVMFKTEFGIASTSPIKKTSAI